MVFEAVNRLSCFAPNPSTRFRPSGRRVSGVLEQIMRLLALTGSLLLLVYILGVIVLTCVNLSRWLFDLERNGEGERFWRRQGIIFLWPLVIMTAEGRAVLIYIWNDLDEGDVS